MAPPIGDCNLDHNEGMDRRDPEYHCDQMQERPHERISMRIRLMQRKEDPPPDFCGLKRDLKKHEMGFKRSKSNKDIFIISGVPPENGFGRQQVFEIVQNYIPSAILVSVVSE